VWRLPECRTDSESVADADSDSDVETDALVDLLLRRLACPALAALRWRRAVRVATGDSALGALRPARTRDGLWWGREVAVSCSPTVSTKASLTAAARSVTTSGERGGARMCGGDSGDARLLPAGFSAVATVLCRLVACRGVLPPSPKRFSSLLLPSVSSCSVSPSPTPVGSAARPMAIPPTCLADGMGPPLPRFASKAIASVSPATPCMGGGESFSSRGEAAPTSRPASLFGVVRWSGEGVMDATDNDCEVDTRISALCGRRDGTAGAEAVDVPGAAVRPVKAVVVRSREVPTRCTPPRPRARVPPPRVAALLPARMVPRAAAVVPGATAGRPTGRAEAGRCAVASELAGRVAVRGAAAPGCADRAEGGRWEADTRAPRRASSPEGRVRTAGGTQQSEMYAKGGGVGRLRGKQQRYHCSVADRQRPCNTTKAAEN